MQEEKSLEQYHQSLRHVLSLMEQSLINIQRVDVDIQRYTEQTNFLRSQIETNTRYIYTLTPVAISQRLKDIEIMKENLTNNLNNLEQMNAYKQKEIEKYVNYKNEKEILETEINRLMEIIKTHKTRYLRPYNEMTEKMSRLEISNKLNPQTKASATTNLPSAPNLSRGVSTPSGELEDYVNVKLEEELNYYEKYGTFVIIPRVSATQEHDRIEENDEEEKEIFRRKTHSQIKNPLNPSWCPNIENCHDPDCVYIHDKYELMKAHPCLNEICENVNCPNFHANRGIGEIERFFNIRANEINAQHAKIQSKYVLNLGKEDIDMDTNEDANFAEETDRTMMMVMNLASDDKNVYEKYSIISNMTTETKLKFFILLYKLFIGERSALLIPLALFAMSIPPHQRIFFYSVEIKILRGEI